MRSLGLASVLAITLGAAPAFAVTLTLKPLATDLEVGVIADIIPVPGRPQEVLILDVNSGSVTLLNTTTGAKRQVLDSGTNATIGTTRSVSLALDPDFDPVSGGGLYLSASLFNADAGAQGNQVWRYDLIDDGDSGFTSSVAPVQVARIEYPEESFENGHFGGAIRFLDDELLLSTGDGDRGIGPPTSPSRAIAGQPDNPMGKIFRFTPDGADSLVLGPSLEVPDDAVYPLGVDAGGLRNPFKITVDPASGRVIIADVGQDRFEEINILQPEDRGTAFFGWPGLEGNAAYNTDATLPDQPPAEDIRPFYLYSHPTEPLTGPDVSDPAFRGDSVTGGIVYTGGPGPAEIEALIGQYLFSDFRAFGLDDPGDAPVWSLDFSGEEAEVRRWMLDYYAGEQRLERTLAIGAAGDGTIVFSDFDGDVFAVTDATVIPVGPTAPALILALGAMALWRRRGRP
ncbi:MAG: PQQ-dependent sugar dehydrogenase [Pseudomonadota bacterium]